MLNKKIIVEDDVEDHFLSPHILFNDRIVAAVHGGENLSQPPNVAAWLDNLSVLQYFQKQGLGYLLMQETLYRCYKKNYTHLGLHVTANNHNALKLYKRLGFEIVGKFFFFTKQFGE